MRNTHSHSHTPSEKVSKNVTALFVFGCPESYGDLWEHYTFPLSISQVKLAANSDSERYAALT